MSIDFMGETVTEDNLEAILRRCAENMPGDYKPDSHSWGGPAAIHLMKQLKGTPLHDRAAHILDDLLVHGSPEEVDFAAQFAPVERISVPRLRGALTRTDLTPEQQRNVRSALARAVSTRPEHYDPSLRAMVGQPSWEAFVGAFLIADHAWLMANLMAVLGKDPTHAATNFWYGVKFLNAAEATELRSDLIAMRPSLGSAYTDALVAVLEDEIRSGTYDQRTGPARWFGIGLVP